MKRKENLLLYNSKIINTYLKFIRRNYDYINIKELLHCAKMESYQVEDPGHWFSQEQINRFHEKLKKLTGNREIARDAGRYSASPDVIGVMKQYVLGLVGPSKAYTRLGKAASNFTKASTFNTRDLGPNKIELVVTLNDGVREEAFQCENRLGYIEAVSKVFNYKLPAIEHPECIFKGGAKCRYIVSWQESPVTFWKKVRNYTALAFAVILLALSLISPFFTLTTMTPLFLGSLILLSWYAVTTEIKTLNSAVNTLKDTSEKLAEQGKINFNYTLMINEIGETLSRFSDMDSLVNRVIEILEKRLDFDRGMILLANRYKTRLVFHSAFGYSGEEIKFLMETVFHLNDPDSKGIFVVSFKKQTPFLINDIHEIEGYLSPWSLDCLKKLGTKSFICCPIIYGKESLGILAVDNIKTKRPLVQSDINLLMGIAPQIGISMQNAMLRDAKAKQYKAILQILTANMEAHEISTLLPNKDSHHLKESNKKNWN
ncbi:MAG: GAF domain-containing protein [Nitrospirae bacterium]|nr:GAF domain-containing protein [Nitrospirota bacterium]